MADTDTGSYNPTSWMEDCMSIDPGDDQNDVSEDQNNYDEPAGEDN